MRILFLITGLDYGGAEKLLFTISSYFVKKGHNVKVVTLLQPQALIKEFSSLNVQVETLHLNGFLNVPKALMRYKEIVYNFQPDIVHAHMVHANILSRLGIKVTQEKYPLINTVHDPSYGTNRLRNFFFRFTNRYTNLITTISKESFDNYIRYTKAPVSKVIYMDNFVDVDFFKKDEGIANVYRKKLKLEEKFVWISIGRLYEQKDYPNLIRAYERLAKDNEGSVLLIVGRGPLEEELKAMIKQKGLSGRIIMLGVRNDIRELLNVADAYVMSSAWEGQPIALLEAAASGLPIVATNVGGNHTVVSDQENGFLVKSNDSGELYKKMKLIELQDTSTRNKMGDCSRALVEKKYSANVMTDKLLALYQHEAAKK
ncbi:glycosyltransferase [Pontibacter flavimaris]|uniref:Glycosyltransferase n=1 Tax=Pontibacter flavimaris TaxID=1797110 RepID=A0A1Q5PCC2_9BACT|nr:glycosyltransferase [Pontibacter flavimaris]OKL39885.1 hypothetical protein A3841_16035 [Pontibacter flavimaris]